MILTLSKMLLLHGFEVRGILDFFVIVYTSVIYRSVFKRWKDHYFNPLWPSGVRDLHYKLWYSYAAHKNSLGYRMLN